MQLSPISLAYHQSESYRWFHTYNALGIIHNSSDILTRSVALFKAGGGKYCLGQFGGTKKPRTKQKQFWLFFRRKECCLPFCEYSDTMFLGQTFCCECNQVIPPSETNSYNIKSKMFPPRIKDLEAFEADIIPTLRFHKSSNLFQCMFSSNL